MFGDAPIHKASNPNAIRKTGSVKRRASSVPKTMKSGMNGDPDVTELVKLDRPSQTMRNTPCETKEASITGPMKSGSHEMSFLMITYYWSRR